MKELSLAVSVHRVGNHDVKPDDVVLKIPVQRGFGSFPFHVAGSDATLEPNSDNRNTSRISV